MTACASKSSDTQSFVEAMTIVCDSAGKDPAYVGSKLRNPEVIKLVASLDALDARSRLDAAVNGFLYGLRLPPVLAFDDQEPRYVE